MRSAVGGAVRDKAILFAGHLEAAVFAISLSRGDRDERTADEV